MKSPDGKFYGDVTVSTRRRIFLSLFLNLGAVSKNSTPGNFTFIWHFGIMATTFDKTRIHFNSDVFAAFAVVRY